MATEEITALLKAWRCGDREAETKLFDVVYRELHQIAAAYLKREKNNHSLQTTALIHEAYLRLANIDMDWQDRSHFFGMAAFCMRRILVQHARHKMREKRGSGQPTLVLEKNTSINLDTPQNLVRLDDALKDLAAVMPRKAKVVEMRFFGGLEQKEMARVLRVSEGTIKRDWKAAKAWIHDYLTRIETSGRTHE